MDKMSQLKKEIKLTETGMAFLENEESNNLEEMRTLYRLGYKNGDHGAWDDALDRIREYAKFFGADIEERKFGNVNK
jgi:hypothetical protein